MIFRKYLGYVFSPDIEFDSFLKRVEVDVMFQVHVLKLFFTGNIVGLVLSQTGSWS